MAEVVQPPPRSSRSRQGIGQEVAEVPGDEVTENEGGSPLRSGQGEPTPDHEDENADGQRVDERSQPSRPSPNERIRGDDRSHQPSAGEPFVEHSKAEQSPENQSQSARHGLRSEVVDEQKRRDEKDEQRVTAGQSRPTMEHRHGRQHQPAEECGNGADHPCSASHGERHCRSRE